MDLENNPLTKLILVAVKEINLVKSQKVNLLLALFMSLLVMGSLVMSFGNINGISDVRVGVAFAPAAADNGKELIAQIKELDSEGQLELTQYGSLLELKSAMVKKQAIVGLYVEQVKPNHQVVVKVIVDNSNVVTAGLFKQLITSKIDTISAIGTRQVVSSVWGEVENIAQQINDQKKQLDDFTLQLNEAKTKLDKLRGDLNQFDVQRGKTALTQKRQSITAIQGKVDSFSSDLDEIDAEIKFNLGEIDSIRNQIQALTNEGVPQSTIAPVLSKLNEYDSKLSSAQDKVNTARNSIAFFKGELQNGSVELAELDVSLNAFANTLDESRQMIETAETARVEVGQKLAVSKEVLEGLELTLEKVAELDKDFVLQPIILNPVQGEGLYQATYLERIIPIGLALVLFLVCVLLTSISFVLEKNEGVHARMLLSSTSPLITVGGKILGQVIFGTILGVLTIVLGIVLLPLATGGVPLHFSISIDLVIGIMVMTFSFVCLGLLIAQFAKTQSTAVLGALLVILPLFFLSGAIIPLDFVNPVVQTFSKWLPLTIAITVFQEILIKGTLIEGILIELGGLIIVGLVMAAYCVTRRDWE